jgi:hypothetical protein
MAISLSGSLEITGSIFASGGITGSFSGTATSASYATNADLLDNRDSTTFANTGSNAFAGSQNINGNVAITGSLTTTGTITAQTLNVQQVTSSVVYSSGSNVFGNSISNTQSMTGSVGISGSLAVAGVATFSGLITSTIGVNNYLRASNTSTDGLFIENQNNGNISYYGLNNSAGTLFFTGANVYSTNIGTASARDFHIGTNGVVRLTIASTGASTFNGALTVKAGNGNQLILDNSAERFTQINLQNNATQKAAIWWDNTNTELVLLANSSGAGHLKIASTGAATFSSTIYASSTITSGTSVAASTTVTGPQGFHSVSTSQVIPFTTWTTFYNIPSGIGLYMFAIGLDNVTMTDWNSFGIIRSSGVDAAFFSQHNGSLVQTRISGMALQVFQNGGSPSQTLQVKIIRIQ